MRVLMLAYDGAGLSGWLSTEQQQQQQRKRAAALASGSREADQGQGAAQGQRQAAARCPRAYAREMERDCADDLQSGRRTCNDND